MSSRPPGDTYVWDVLELVSGSGVLVGVVLHRQLPAAAACSHAHPLLPPAVLLATCSSFFMLLAVTFGLFQLLLATFSYFWLFPAASGYFQLPQRYLQLFLATCGTFWALADNVFCVVTRMYLKVQEVTYEHLWSFFGYLGPGRFSMKTKKTSHKKYWLYTFQYTLGCRDF